MMPTVPAYLRIAADLRRTIVEGGLEPGAKLPTETKLMAVYGVSRTVAKYAINVLKDEGLVEGRRGSGVYVRNVPRLVRRGNPRDQRSQPDTTLLVGPDTAGTTSGPNVGLEHSSVRGVAPAGIAERLTIGAGAPVMCTRYRLLADEQPVQLCVSWEPLELTGGTAVEWPEECGVSGVVARLEAIGVRVDESVETVADRTATPEEIEALGLSLRGARVQGIKRTHYAAGRPVETADIVLVAARYELVYRLPID